MLFAVFKLLICYFEICSCSKKVLFLEHTHYIKITKTSGLERSHNSSIQLVQILSFSSHVHKNQRERLRKKRAKVSNEVKKEHCRNAKFKKKKEEKKEKLSK